jgi:hypothetical protein
MLELQRTIEKKKIPNIVRTLRKLRGDGALLNRTMTLLSYVLASESTGIVDGDDSLDEHELVVYLKPLLSCFK